jgi:TRAP-type mannitol/chloroaromatic compound transport system permease small subunit
VAGPGKPDLSLAARLLRSADAQLFRLESWLNLVAAIVILGLMLLGVAHILSRKLFNWPIPSYIDVIELVMVLFAFPGLAYAQRLGAHIRMEIVVGRIRGRTLFAAEIFGTLLAVAIVAVLAWFAFEHFARAWVVGDSTMDGDIPLWPAKLVVPLALAVLLARFLIQLAAFGRLLADPATEPIAVPRMDSVDEHAKREVETGVTPGDRLGGTA